MRTQTQRVDGLPSKSHRSPGINHVSDDKSGHTPVLTIADRFSTPGTTARKSFPAHASFPLMVAYLNEDGPDTLFTCFHMGKCSQFADLWLSIILNTRIANGNDMLCQHYLTFFVSPFAPFISVGRSFRTTSGIEESRRGHFISY